jgi:hypothetical protein
MLNIIMRLFSKGAGLPSLLNLSKILLIVSVWLLPAMITYKYVTYKKDLEIEQLKNKYNQEIIEMSNSVRDTINYLNTEKQKAIIEYQKKMKRTNDYYNKIMRQLNEAKRKDPEIKEYLDTPIPEPIVKQLLSIQRNNKTESDNR